MPPFTLHTPDTLENALKIAKSIESIGGIFDWVAGGTDLLPNYKWHLNPKENVISLAKIEDLTKLSSTHIGAMVRIQDLADSKSTHPVLAKSANSIASILIRRSGTVGGNLCLDTRCYWYNQTENWRESIDWCHKCDCGTGSDCRVIPNQNTLCVATYQADLAPVLMCMGAKVHLISTAGQREMLLNDFFELDGMTKNKLKPGELITHITLPKNISNWSGDYQKLRQRESWDFPEAGVAVLWRKENNKLMELRVATTGLESIPGYHEEIASELVDNWDGKESIRTLSENIRKAVKPVQNTWYSASYRRKMVRVLTKRACEGLMEI
ncbi:MAG: 4-hydroxybenzoyl-CoA reductase subunit beta [Candidatus Thalassarchaeaceae archaeon]|jgi:4-hydroxybenzoyl-CoA reductase subunit beta|tara:strand:- start:249 stop:1223 length:975 start_codon:yes stop_codon:yes gene_type:complete